MKAEIRWDFVAVLAFCALFSSPVYAVVADKYLPDSYLPKPLCEIQFKDGDGQGTLTNTCSGTLIGSKYVLTAAHCGYLLTSSDIRAQVFCDGSFPMAAPNNPITSFGRDVVGMARNPLYENDNGFMLHDMAIFEIDGAYDDVTPMPLASSADEAQTLLAQGPSGCQFWGFGGNSYGITGRPQGAAFDLKTIAEVTPMLGNQGAPPAEILFTGPNHAAPGDSGGPVICWDNSAPGAKGASGAWVQVGVTSQMQTNVPLSIHDPISDDIDWLDATLALPRLPALPQ